MKVSRLLPVLLIGLAASPSARAEPGAWEQVGPAGAWAPTMVGAVLKGKLYTVETNGGLWVTDLSNGKWSQIGKSEFGNTRFLYAAGDSLYTIEKDGSLYRVNPEDGTWSGVGPAGAWKPTRHGTILKGKLYTVETNGGLWVTDLSNGKWSQIGKPEFGKTRHMYAAGNSLYTIEDDGSLYRVNPGDGSWVGVGTAGAWKPTIVGTVLKGKLYTVETNGGLWVTDLGTGSWEQLGKPEFGTTKFMFPAGDALYTIEQSGNLYRVSVK